MSERLYIDDECLEADACGFVHSYCLDSNWTKSGTTLQCCPEGWDMIGGSCQRNIFQP